MNILLLIVRLLLALTFVIAGLTKLADLAGSRKAMYDFGLPTWLAGPLGLLLPLAELAVAISLISTAIAWWGAIGSLALLLLFIIGISYNLVRGRTPDCHCFGQLYSKPISWQTLVRNLLLAAIAGFVVTFGRTNAGLSATDWFTMLPLAQRIEIISGVLLLAAIVGIGWFLVQILQQQGRLLLRLEQLEAEMYGDDSNEKVVNVEAEEPRSGLAVGSQAPDFALAGLYGETLTLNALRANGKPTLLLFSDPSCSPCTALMPEVGYWQRTYANKLNLVLISRGTPEINRPKTTEHGITQVLLQQDREVANAYQVHATPGAVLITPNGIISSSAALGSEAVRTLVARSVGLPILKNVPTTVQQRPLEQLQPVQQQTSAPKIGMLAPSFTLPDLEGQPIHLSDFQGRETLIVFWNPGCGFCQRMLKYLKAWEEQSPVGAPQLLIVSTGTVKANREMGLSSKIVLDESFKIGSQFGANGTPMAVLIDAQGRIASERAAGAPAVLALAGVRQEAGMK